MKSGACFYQLLSKIVLAVRSHNVIRDSSATALLVTIAIRESSSYGLLGSSQVATTLIWSSALNIMEFLIGSSAPVTCRSPQFFRINIRRLLTQRRWEQCCRISIGHAIHSAIQRN